MKNYLVLYYSTPEAMATFMKLTDEEKQASAKAWDTWKATHGDLVTDLGAPLMSFGSIGNLEIETLPTQIISGYSMVKAENIEKAKSIFNQHPYKENGIHIFESIAI